ncbi:multidrug effflux MFS transporter [Cognatishimia sp. WU-CL00825]|uniref:multidrug effflux MFS transporter n=1 Tax=Cognatishimia sp. WU-CL00825 TaxID=3127658 RepID=UPI0031049D55
MQPTSRAAELELIALVAMLFATIALSIDAMLPALTAMGQELSPAAPDRATLVVGVFLIGMGVGTFFTGPLSDAIGRKPVILGGFGFYLIGALICGMSTTLEGMLLGRFVQGLAVSGPRIAGVAMVRDLYKGERMAAIMSFAMMIFVLVPAIAPLIGLGIMAIFDWRGIFFAFALFAVIIGAWLAFRRAETLPPANRKPMSVRGLTDAVFETFANRIFRFSVAVQTMVYTALFSTISTIQPIYAQNFGIGDEFALFFAASALLSMPASYVNARVLPKFGMRRLVKIAIITQMILSILALIVFFLGGMTVWVFFAWATSLLLAIGFVFGNLNALAMEPLGHIAGMAASISGAASTILSACLAIPISLSFDGTPKSLLLGVVICQIAAYLLMLKLGPREV